MREYDPGSVIVTWAGIPFFSFADGSMISAVMDSDSYTDQAGTTGEVVRVKSLDTRGEVTISLMDSAPENDLMMAKYMLDRQNGTGKGPLLIKDLSGSTVIQADDAWIKKLPDNTKGKEAGAREWVLRCAKLNSFVGGNK